MAINPSKATQKQGGNIYWKKNASLHKIYWEKGTPVFRKLIISRLFHERVIENHRSSCIIYQTHWNIYNWENVLRNWHVDNKEGHSLSKFFSLVDYDGDY